jgi:hypothetical protein
VTAEPPGEPSAPPVAAGIAAVPPTYDLPGPRRVVSSGLQLAAAASRDLRDASLYVGLLTVGMLGPTLVYGLSVVARYHLTSQDMTSGALGDSAAAGPLAAVVVMIYAAVLGFVAVAIDGQLIAVALLGARAGERTFTLREATTRARQVFWRIVAATIVVSVLNAIVQLAVQLALGDGSGSGQAVTVLAPIVAVVVLAPLGYVTTGIVLGDVGPWEAIRRSVRLARARPLIALVVALFTLLTSAIQVFALSAGLDILARIADFFHLGVSAGGVAVAATIVGLLAFVAALGSLIVTVAAIVAAPQVAAFLGLTFYSGGLDRARVGVAGGSQFRWVTRPMQILMAILGIAALIGVANLG